MKNLKLKSIFSLITFALMWSYAVIGQEHQGDVFVDENGVMRWGDTKKEVHGFGVNYTVPFAHAYRSAGKKGLDIKKEIDKDVYHFARLNFDLYRVHVWDTEISDEKGNLIENEHLENFDYLIKQLKDRGFNFVITPIAFWGNGWPEPDEETPGFSHKFGKDKSLTNPEAIKAQQNYLAQFLNHVNPYTGIAYKNEPNIIAFEVSNEPHHRGTPAEVKDFIQGMLESMRSTGTKKPTFYNVSHSIQLAETYFTSGIQGGTFQWYPTGLGFGEELEGNLLPNVNEYSIPFDAVISKNKGAKLVYEFDAADVNKSYMYPAMARSFREAGIQIATHFAYDPTFLAYVNTEYNTHYMNLNYVPHKALGLMIASEIFHEVPMGKDLGTYPENLKFGDFTISYEGDVATYNSAEKFIYTNSNTLQPKDLKNLNEIAGHGNSGIIKYDGKGAYFLDKLENGAWRLEVMPDPFMIKNPFGKNSLDKTIAIINWAENTMKIELPDLGADFKISGINVENSFTGKAENGTFTIAPGTYLIQNSEKDNKKKKFNFKRNFSLEEFVATETSVDKTYLLHEPLEITSENIETKIEATVISNAEIQNVEAWFQNGNTYESVELSAENFYDFSAKIPQEVLQEGFLKYRIIVSTNEGKFTFPGGVAGSPSDWDFYGEDYFETAIVKADTPITLFEAVTDSDQLVIPWSPKNQLIPIGLGKAEHQVKIDSLFQKDAENMDEQPLYNYAFKYNFLKNLKGRKGNLTTKDALIINARSLSASEEKMEISLVMDNGAAFGKIITLKPEMQEIIIPLYELQPTKTVTLPRPYPSFLPYYFDHHHSGDFEIERIENIQFSIGPGIGDKNLQKAHEIGIEKVYLQ
ncbi:hypothetical protein [Gramella sp. AN32]|uniref:Glycoside hydrolase family 5 domain-containing protein n=1 Tax=Christiangramia antarctica TaxID=2058158 RepID=A0ABW5X110_9FLAO|nr:hypothetical protein [Gramella sp. AN32]MCM4155627.1 hypothetical protein [Gramella sp. AN32]